MTGIDGQPCGPPYRESVVGHGTNGLDEANFGGDGGGTLTGPANECNIAQDYVYLSIQVTQNCAVNDGSWIDDASKVTSYDVAPADNATGETRFIAPLAADAESPSTWIAGGRHVWVQTHGYAIRSGDEWASVTTSEPTTPRRPSRPPAARSTRPGAAPATTRAPPAASPSATLGAPPGRSLGEAPAGTTSRSRSTGPYPTATSAASPSTRRTAGHVVITVNGFPGQWTEGPGPGARVGHVFESKDGGTTWKDISRNFPDVAGRLRHRHTVGRPRRRHRPRCRLPRPGRSTWQRVGDLPAVAVLQLKLGLDGRTLYAATHGRGIYSIKVRDFG